MGSLFTIFILFLLFLILKYMNKNVNIESFNEITSTALDDALFEVQTEQIPLTTEATASTSTSASQHVFSSGALTKKDIQYNQGLVFDNFIREVDQNNDAQNVLLLKSDNEQHDIGSIYPIRDLKIRIDNMETVLNNKLTLQTDSTCNNLSNYCFNDDDVLSADQSLYTSMSASDFNDKLNTCYDLCSTFDNVLIENYRTLLYDTLFDILQRNEVIEKITGDINLPVNNDKYEYIIKNNTNESVPTIRFDMSLFSSRHINHIKFVNELHIFLKIVNLEIRKIELNNIIHNDNKEIIKNNYIINNIGDATTPDIVPDTTVDSQPL